MALRIALASSEIYPFSKTGGLADVSSALGRYLAAEGHDVRIFSPLHAVIDTQRFQLTPVDFLREIPVQLGPHFFSFSVYTAQLPKTGVWVYFVHCPALYDRPAIYTSRPDEHLRYLLLSRAVFESCQRMGFSPHILHCNDWQTAMIPLLRRSTYAWDGLFHNTRTVLTLHNIGYQGIFGAETAPAIVSDEHRYLLHQDDLRAGFVNFLKTGILFADALTTVSPTYAGEIQDPELGAGLEGYLRSRRESLIGILNGVDYQEWSPDHDSLIPHRYGPDDVLEGKSLNKRVLLGRLGLPEVNSRVPLVGIISRLVVQKGFDLLNEPLPRLLEQRPMQLAVLGSGETRYEDFFSWLQQRFPDLVCFYRGYSNELSHLIEAGADMFLMPSRYEPCGLNQMYSLRYGTAPIVRKTGGLADSVQPFNPETRQGTGFVFQHFTSEGVRWALNLALDTYQDPNLWQALIANAMKKDFSWEKQVKEYVRLYQSLQRARLGA